MGRPFIVYSDDESGTEQECSCSISYELFKENAMTALLSSGLEAEADDPVLCSILRRFFSLQRTAYIPKVEPAPDGLDLLASKIGGRPYLVAGESWPSHNGNPMVFLWQFRVSQLPRAVRRELGYSSGLMQVFVSAERLATSTDGKWFLARVLGEHQLQHRDRAEVVPPPLPAWHVARSQAAAGAGAGAAAAAATGPGEGERAAGAGAGAGPEVAMGSGAGAGADGGREGQGEEWEDGDEPLGMPYYVSRGMTDMALPELRLTGWDEVPDYPCREDALSRFTMEVGRSAAREVLEALQDAGVFVPVEGDKLLGWPNWIEDPDWSTTATGAQYRQIAQVEGGVVPLGPSASRSMLVLQRHPTDRTEWEAGWSWW